MIFLMHSRKCFLFTIIILNISKLCFSKVSKDECTLNLVWGHGSTNFYNAIRNKKYKGRSIAMACGSRDIGDINTQIYQGNSNGDWMRFIYPDYNGGLNPILSEEN